MISDREPALLAEIEADGVGDNQLIVGVDADPLGTELLVEELRSQDNGNRRDPGLGNHDGELELVRAQVQAEGAEPLDRLGPAAEIEDETRRRIRGADEPDGEQVARADAGIVLGDDLEDGLALAATLGG